MARGRPKEELVLTEAEREQLQVWSRRRKTRHKPGGFFADASTLAASKKSVGAYHEAVQVGHSGKDNKLFQFGPRQKVQAFTLKEDLCVGKAYALANDQYGPGGGMQYYVTAKDRMSMEKGPIMELTSP